MPPHPLTVRAAAGALGLACCIAGVTSLGTDATGHPGDLARPDAGTVGPPCTAVATPASPPAPAAACTAAAPSPADGIVLDGVTYGVATEDDDVLVVDPACDGQLIVMVLRPDGSVFGFPHRPSDATPVFGLPLTRADRGQALGTDAGPCPQPVLRRGFDVETTPVPVAELREETTP